MKPNFVKLVMSALLFGTALFCNGQVLTEDDIGFEMLKWHFHHYPHSVSKQWQKIGEHAMQAEFTFNEKDYKTIYLLDGTRLSEEVDMTKDLPLSIEYYLDEKFGKYKVQSFKKVTVFKDEKLYYSMSLKTKDKEDETLSFDEHLIPVDFALISSID